MDKDRQEAAQKCRAVIRLPEARPKRVRGTAKAAASGGSQPMLAAKSAAPRSSKVPNVVKAAGVGVAKSASAGATKARDLSSPVKRVADFGTDISVEDYLIGKSLAHFFRLLILCRIGRGATCCCSACGGDHGVCHGAWGEG
jgi:hypothetical protein